MRRCLAYGALAAVVAVLAAPAMAGPADAGVTYGDDAPRPGDRLSAPIVVSGHAEAIEGIQRITLYVLPAAGAAELRAHATAVGGVGRVAFRLPLDPRLAPAGRVTIRVIATTPMRGLSADIEGVVVVHPRAVPRPHATTPLIRVRRAPRPVAAPAPRPDDSGATFGTYAPLLPYSPARIAPVAPTQSIALAAGVTAAPDPRSPWVSLAAGLLMLAVAGHAHLALRRVVAAEPEVDR